MLHPLRIPARVEAQLTLPLVPLPFPGHNPHPLTSMACITTLARHAVYLRLE
jgi:hypothetical protein